MDVTRNFSRTLQFWERTQALLMPTNWPARLATHLGVGETVTRVDVEIVLAKSIGIAPVLRIAFASDFHVGPTTPFGLIERACDQIHAARPDLILLGGDFISIRTEYVDSLVEPLSALRPRLGVFAVFGNHDHWSGLTRVKRALERAGIEQLTNQSRRLPAPFEGTLLVGLDDHTSGHPDPDGPSWDESCATVVLMHQPSGLLDVGDRPFDVAFAGHTHGGHILLPGGFAPVAPHGALSRQYRAGRYDLRNERTLLVSRGIGNGALPFRLGAPSDVIICTLRGGGLGAVTAPDARDAPV